MNADGQFKKRFVAGAATMGVARILEQVATFARNLILANLLGAENQGIAATFAIGLSFLGMLSDFSAGRLIVQADDGEDSDLQSSLHLWEILRGAALGCVLFMASDSIALFFHASSTAWAFKLLSLVPVLKGFEHLDLRRFQRDMRFGRYAISSLLPQLLTAALAYPLARVFEDYSAALYLVILQAATTVVASHMLAQRPFRVGMRREHVQRLLEFGMPLILNGILLFAVLQGDRVIVGRFYTPTDLGVYATAAALALMAANLLMSFVSPLALPALSRARNDAQRYSRILGKMMDLSTVFAVAVGLGFVVLGPTVLQLLYRSDYWPASSFIGILGLSSAFRTLRVVPNSAQMARAENMALFYSNAFRIIGTVLALFAGMRAWPLSSIAWCGVIGELAALVATAWLLRLQQKIGLVAVILPAAVVLGAVTVGWAATLLPVWAGSRILNLIVGTTVCSLLTGIVVMLRPMLRKEAFSVGFRVYRRLSFVPK